jgi:hypothetical protein
MIFSVHANGNVPLDWDDTFTPLSPLQQQQHHYPEPTVVPLLLQQQHFKDSLQPNSGGGEGVLGALVLRTSVMCCQVPKFVFRPVYQKSSANLKKKHQCSVQLKDL